MIDITTEAADHLKRIQDAEGKYPRLSVAGGGCAGFKYVWELVAADDVNDMIDEQIELSNGGCLVVDGMSMMYLFGTEISLKTGIFGTVLEINSPTAVAGCGCGESVNFDMDAVAANMDQGFTLPK
jgi:iron-sulfur cluster assembly protein